MMVTSLTDVSAGIQALARCRKCTSPAPQLTNGIPSGLCPGSVATILLGNPANINIFNCEGRWRRTYNGKKKVCLCTYTNIYIYYMYISICLPLSLFMYNVVPPQLYTIHVIQAGGSDKTPAVITRRYSDFRRLHATLCRDHAALMERVCFPRKCCTQWRDWLWVSHTWSRAQPQQASETWTRKLVHFERVRLSSDGFTHGFTLRFTETLYH